MSNELKLGRAEQALRDAELVRAERQENFVDTARRVAMGDESVTAEEIERVTTAAGKEISEFKTMVDSLKYRRELRRRMAELSGAAERMKEVRAKVEKQNKILDEAVALHRQICGPLQEEIRRLNSDAAEAHNLPGELARSCPCPRLKERSKDIQAERDAVGRRTTRLIHAIPDAESAVRRAARGDDRRVTAEAAERLDALRAELAEWQGKERELAAQADAVRREQIEV